ncbi:MAG: response regulator [Betaproteobacteria bacterium]|nr:response regulator [Betaproteobacteria bacterium]
MKILLVEDSRAVAVVMAARLGSFGYEVVLAENGQIALDKFQESAPDLVLMDIEMPVMDGFEAANRIRQIEAATSAWTPIIFLTASNTHENLITAIEAGGDDFLAKNWPESILQAKMKAMTRINTLRQRLANNLAQLTETNRNLADAQNQLLQSQTMASVGQLAAGVAHEINNPIGFINSNLGSLQGQVEGLLKVISAYEAADPVLTAHPALLSVIAAAKKSADLDFLREDIVTLLGESRGGLARVAKIVSNLKDFSHVDNADWQFVKLEAGLDSTLEVVASEIKPKAEIRKEYAGLPEVECMVAQINQVFAKLLVNAAQAIEGRGSITLRTGFDAREAWVEIEDTGKGIPPENMQRIFDPFFSTLPVGQGTGMGLSLAYSIARGHHGRIEVVKSVVGQGSTFRLTLPLRRPAGA